jgi:hypothetical protein
MPIRFQVDSDFYDHPKTIDMSDAATALWTRAGSYSAAKLTDGFVADAVLARLTQTPEEASRELIRRGLWKRVRGGYQFHQWDERNLSRARVEAERTSDRQRKRRERQLAQQNGNQQVKGHIVQPESAPESTVTPGGIRGLSVSVSESVSVSVSGRDDSRAEPPTACAEHRNDPDPPACGACKRARLANEAWHADKRRRLDAAPDCPKPHHQGQPAYNCALCRSEQLEAKP